MENPPLIERKVDVKPAFELTSPRVSREFMLFLCDQKKGEYASDEGKMLVEKQRERIEKMFDSASGILDEDDLRGNLMNQIDEKKKNPKMSVEELSNLNADGDFLKSTFYKIDSWRDPLMGLYNRRGVTQILGMLVEHPKEILGDKYEQITMTGFSLMLLDVDNLKKWNDQKNHHRGDAALTEFASAITENVRPTDIVARLSGDEVLIIALGADENDAKVADTKISCRLNDIVIENEKITYSAGADNGKNWEDIKKLVNSKNPEMALTSLLEDADQRLYEAKSSGRNRLVTDCD